MTMENNNWLTESIMGSASIRVKTLKADRFKAKSGSSRVFKHAVTKGSRATGNTDPAILEENKAISKAIVCRFNSTTAWFTVAVVSKLEADNNVMILVPKVGQIWDNNGNTSAFNLNTDADKTCKVEDNRNSSLDSMEKTNNCISNGCPRARIIPIVR